MVSRHIKKASILTRENRKGSSEKKWLVQLKMRTTKRQYRWQVIFIISNWGSKSPLRWEICSRQRHSSLASKGSHVHFFRDQKNKLVQIRHVLTMHYAPQKKKLQQHSSDLCSLIGICSELFPRSVWYYNIADCHGLKKLWIGENLFPRRDRSRQTSLWLHHWPVSC